MKLSSRHLSRLVQLKSRKGRLKHRAFIVSGVRAVSELIGAGWKPELYAVARSELTDTGREFVAKLNPTETYDVTTRDLRKVDSSTTSQGVIALVPYEDPPARGMKSDPVLALDDIADPSNLGSILRSAHAFNFRRVIMGTASCDPFSPKVIRAAAGMLFHLDLKPVTDMTAAMMELRDSGYSILGADMGGSEISSCPAGLDRICLVVGNEAFGMSPEVAALCDMLVRIPISDKCESLSAPVAAAIVMYEVSKNLTVCDKTAQHRAS